MEQQLKDIIAKALNVDAAVINEDLAAGDIPEWDSVAHVNLLMEVEKAYAIAFDVADAIDIESVGDFVDTLKKYTS